MSKLEQKTSTANNTIDFKNTNYITSIYDEIRAKQFCKCSECGEQAEVETGLICTSIPPKYKYTCKSCGHVGYIESAFVDFLPNQDKKLEDEAHDKIDYDKYLKLKYELVELKEIIVELTKKIHELERQVKNEK